MKPLRSEKTFFSPKGEFSIKLDTAGAAVAPITSTGIMVFDGEIDLERFYQAIDDSSKDYTWLFSTLRERNGNTFVEHISSGKKDAKIDGSFKLEIEFMDRCFSIEDNPEMYLPKKIHTKMRNPILAFASVNGLPCSAFKITIMNGFFVIGAFFNHCFFDMSSMYYYLLYLSDTYSNGSTKLATPIIQMKSSISGGPAFKNMDEFIAAKPDGLTLTPKTPKNLPGHNVFLSINLQTVQKLKKSSPKKISTNDIIHGILLKLMAENPKNKNPSSSLELFFYSDMRFFFKLPENTVGDFTFFLPIKTKLSKARESSILELAQLSSSVAHNITKEHGQNFSQWVLQIKKFKNDPILGMDFFNSPKKSLVSNCSPYPYEKINFDNSKVKTIMTKQNNRAIGLFCHVDYELTEDSSKGISVFISSHYPELIDTIKTMGKESGLFSTTTLPRRKGSGKVKFFLILIRYLLIKISQPIKKLISW